MNDIQKVFQEMQRLNKVYNTNLWHNYKHREVRCQHLGELYFKNYTTDNKITGPDATSTSHKVIEIKSGAAKMLKSVPLYSASVRVEFDKQNDVTQRKKTLNFDGLITLFVDKSEEPIFYAVIKHPKAMKKLREILKQKQDEYLALEDPYRDSISLFLKELFTIPYVIYHNGSRRVPKKQIKSKFKL